MREQFLNKVLTDCELRELRAAQTVYESSQKIKSYQKKLFWANLEKWAWRSAAVLATYKILSSR
ncbi:MAG: hypothetical protein EAZ80_01565 [Runella slithyformis]|nr:MAG: hypothetical protein EAZ80_01565 [Runella slithyformis]TAF48682.1 MAG: hypothetical protein EAZ63_03790 [Runella slithyformis]